MLITEFFSGRELFITGGTGYLGKSFIEKILRVCPDISKIYLLIRVKKNKSPYDRLKDFSNDLVFERLHRERPGALEKVIPIVGDSVELGMGISAEDLKRMENVSIIMHGAANVRFDNNLRSSILMNTRGTHELLKLAVTHFKHLLAFVHISTAYINPFLFYIEEKLYDSPVDWRSAIKIAETYDEETLEILKLKYSKYYPNAYSFTKNLSEQVVAEFVDKLPITILRPSIVVHSMMEPEPGYIDNLNGPMGLLVAIAMGISQVTFCGENLLMALIHVDLITEFTIIATYKRGLDSINSKGPGLEIRNFTPGKLLKHNLGQCAKIFVTHTNKEPFEKSLWAPNICMVSNFFVFNLAAILINIPMALVYDALLTLSGKERMVMKLTRKYVYVSKAVGNFAVDFYDFDNKGMWELYNCNPEKERHLFGLMYHVQDRDFSETMKNLRDGVKKYIFKEPLKTTPATKRRYKFFLILDKIITFSVFYLVVVLLWKLVN